LAVLAILQPDARTSARLGSVLGDGHSVVTRRSWEGVEDVLSERAVEGCLVDADHPRRAEAEERIRHLRSLYPTLAIIAYVEAGRGGGYFDLGKLGVDALITSETPRNQIRADVDQAFARTRATEVADVVAGRAPVLLAGALSWAITHATSDTSVGRMAEDLGETTRGLRRALSAADLPSPSRILLWGRLLLAGARLERDGRSVEDVAFSLRYATSSSLARAMKHHTGYTLKWVSEQGGMLLVLERLLPARREARPARPAPSAIAGRT
jgi:AraC-like DNA-binding protein